MKKVITCLVLLALLLLSSTAIDAQGLNFYDIVNPESTSSRRLGKTVYNYKSTNIRYIDSSYQSVILKLTQLQDYSWEDIVDDLNANPNIEILEVSLMPGFFQKVEWDSIPPFPLDKLHHIKCLYMKGISTSYWGMHEMWMAMSDMPSLQYAILESFEPLDIPQSAFDKLNGKIKGLFTSAGFTYDTSAHKIALEHFYIKGKHDNIKSSIEALELDRIKDLFVHVDSLSDDIFLLMTKMSKLERLYLSTTKSSDIDVTQLGDLPLVKDLGLFLMDKKVDTWLPHLPSSDKLETLKIKSSRNDTIWRSPLPPLPRLKKLVINGGFQEIGSMTATPKLSTLIVNYNNLRTLPTGLSNLQKLQARGNQIVSLKPLIACEYLQDLDLANNAIEESQVLTSLHKLERIDLSSNKIKELPSMQMLSMIKELRIDNNCLTRLPEDLGTCSMLETLVVGGKTYSSRHGKSSLDNIKTIPCVQMIESIPSSLADLPHLKRLKLDYSATLDSSDVKVILQSRSKGLEASLVDCSIGTLPSSGWHNSRLKKLDLRRNLIDTLPPSFYRTTTAVNLRGNKLLEPWDFNYNSPEIKLLVAHHHGLVPTDTLYTLDSLVKVIAKKGSGYYDRSINLLNHYLPLAADIDSAYIFSQIKAENVAESLQKRGQYEEAIKFYTMYLDEAMSSRMQFANEIVKNLYNRHECYLELGEVEAAVNDLETIASAYNFDLAYPALYEVLLVNQDMRYLDYIDSTLQYYDKLLTSNPQDSMGILLSQLEIMITSNDHDRVLQFANEIADMELNPYYNALFAYLMICETHDQEKFESAAATLMTNLEHQGYRNLGWRCDLISAWSKQLSPKKQVIINKMNEVLCP